MANPINKIEVVPQELIDCAKETSNVFSELNESLEYAKGCVNKFNKLLKEYEESTND